ncbi:MAG: TonB-dependent receptor, partial [Candidatus Omnitrophica bacterium]|nr:TonB-dependent receptor [Candidatus Omnitrophota bacterium]
IINVKTKSPKDLKGTYIKTAYSDLEDLYGGIIHGGEINALSYKVSASWDRGENLENVWGGKERELNRVDVRGDYDLDFDKKIFVQSGQIDGQYQVRCLNGGSFKEIIPGERYYRIGYEQGELQLTAYRNRSRPHELSISGGSVKSVESDLYNLDLNHSFAWGENLSFVWGGNISKEKAVNPDIIYDKLTARLWSAYLQNQIRLTEKVIMSLGSRIDDDSVRGNNFTPRIGFVYEPIENHAYRISYSTAYRKPSFLELFRYLKNKSGTNLGNEDLDNEELKSIELGYYGIFSKNLKGSVALFFNEIEHLIEEYTVSSKVFNYRNIEQKVESLGGEIEANYAIQNGISCFANYAYEYLRYKDSGERIKSSPLNKINLGIITELTKEFSVNMFVSYVDSVEWAQSGVYTVDSKTPSYTLLNSRIAYKFTENGKATMEIFNILNDKHKEYPYGEEIGQRITVGVNYNF